MKKCKHCGSNITQPKNACVWLFDKEQGWCIGVPLGRDKRPQMVVYRRDGARTKELVGENSGLRREVAGVIYRVFYKKQQDPKPSHPWKRKMELAVAKSKQHHTSNGRTRDIRSEPLFWPRDYHVFHEAYGDIHSEF